MAGRPTKYSAAAQKAAEQYVDGGFVNAGDVVPSRSSLALELGITRQTLRNWGAEHGKFLATLERCDQMQERLALSGGLKNELNSAIVKLILANHGYSEKQQFEHSGPNGGPITTRNATDLTDDQLAAIATASRD